jgi:N-acetylglutamate synthase-like GNAT family acetyltransferase
MQFAVESVSKWAGDAEPLVYAHWQELGMDQDLKIDPNIDRMEAMEAMAMFKVISAREDGVLKGYLLAVVSPHLHYQSSPPMFIVDAYYITPDARTGTGARLFKFAEALAKDMGCIKIYASFKLHKDHAGFFDALGYKQSDIAVIKRI